MEVNSRLNYDDFGLCLAPEYFLSGRRNIETANKNKAGRFIDKHQLILIQI